MTAAQSGTLYLRINDHPSSRGNNEGGVCCFAEAYGSGTEGFSARRKPRPCRHDFDGSNPTCHGHLGSRGPRPPCRRRHFHEERAVKQRISSLCGTRAEDSFTSHRSPCTPRGLVRGHTTLCPRLGYELLLDGVRRARPPAGNGAPPLCTPHAGCPCTRLADDTWAANGIRPQCRTIPLEGYIPASGGWAARPRDHQLLFF